MRTAAASARRTTSGSSRASSPPNSPPREAERKASTIWRLREVPAPDQRRTDVGDAFAARTGFEPRRLATPCHYFRIRPQRIQAWREANELGGRDLMRDGRWVASG